MPLVRSPRRVSKLASTFSVRFVVLAGWLLGASGLLLDPAGPSPLARGAQVADADATGPPARDGESPGLDAESGWVVGIGGVYRVGHWTGLHRPSDGQAAASESTNAASDRDRIIAATDAIETLDPDGVRVRFNQGQISSTSTTAQVPGATAQAPGATAQAPWAYAMPGGAGAPLRWLDAEGNVITQGRFVGRAIEPSLPWVVAIGDSLGIEQIGRNDLLARESSVAVSQVVSASDLPDRAAGWEGVDLLVITANGRAILRTLDPPRVAALTSWLRNGGRLFVSLGRSGAEMLAEVDWLADLIGIAPGGTIQKLDPASLETYTTSQTPLPTLDSYPLPTAEASGGRTLLSGRTTARQTARLAIERLEGLGRVCVAAFALDEPVLAAWPERLTLITRLHPGLLEADPDQRREVRNRAAVPYDDLAGQLRAALDRFDSNRRLPFSILSLALLLLAALIGPVDYLLVNRVLGKPLLGWVSFPLSVLAMSALFVYLGVARGGDAAGPKIARVEFVDISALTEQPIGRALAVTHLSSRSASRLDFPARVNEVWARAAVVDPAATSPAAQVGGSPLPAMTLTRTQGHPGPTFGGITISGENRTLPAYEIALGEPQGVDASAPSFGGGMTGRPLGFPIPPAGSKAWLTRWSFKPQLGKVSGLTQRRGNDLLAGSITNPLAVDLLDGVLVYGNWSYLLPTRFRAGQTIASIESLRQKNFRWHLTKREIADNASKLAVWDVEMHDDWSRLSELLMFASAVGGRDYTGLKNRALGELDLSHVLAGGHAILYGRVAEPIFENEFTPERPTVSAARIVLPVAPLAASETAPTTSPGAGNSAATPPTD